MTKDDPANINIENTNISKDATLHDTLKAIVQNRLDNDKCNDAIAPISSARERYKLMCISLYIYLYFIKFLLLLLCYKGINMSLKNQEQKWILYPH
jgi:hypothetical protein